MPFSAFDPVDEDRSNQDAVGNQQKVAELTASATPDVAARLSELYKKYPFMPANVVLAMAKAGVSDNTAQSIAKFAAKTTNQQLDPNKPSSQSWFARTVYNPFKSATRWTFAALSLVPDLAQNLGSEVLNPDNPQGMDGFLKSTQFGTMLANSGQAGSGFFMGGDAAKLQAERARKFRGTINGHAWTVGRGAAQMVFTPGSKAYNVLSGFVDAAVMIGTDPTTYLGPKIKEARLAKQLIPSLEGAEEVGVFARVAERGVAGVTEAEQKIFDNSTFVKWVQQSPRATRLTERIAGVAADTSLDHQDKVLRILKDFDFNISVEHANLFAEADSVDKVKGILGTAARRLGNDPNEVLLPKYISDIHGAKWSAAFDDVLSERVPGWQSWRHSRYFASMPKGTVVVNGPGLDRSAAVKTYSNYLRGLGISEDSEKYINTMRIVTEAYGTQNPGDFRPAAQAAFDSVLDTVMDHAGIGKKSRDEVIKEIVTRRNNFLAQARAYTYDEAGFADDGGFVQLLRSAIGDDAFRELSPEQLNRAVMTSPGALVELAQDIAVLPDFRAMRRASGVLSKFGPVFNSKTTRSAFDAVEFVQQEIWKPLQLATGGYVMRNMIDAQTRIAMHGLRGAFNHPMDFMMWVLRKKGLEDITGAEFDNAIGRLTQNWTREQEEFYQALTFDMYRHLDDSVAANERALRNGNWSLVDRSDRNAHTVGYVDNLRQLFGDDEINRQLARLHVQGYDEGSRVAKVQEWLDSETGASTKDRIKNYLRQGIRYTDPETGKYGFIAVPEDKLDEMAGYWVDRLSTFKVSSITRGDRDLNIVAGFNVVPKPVSPSKVRMSTLDPADFIKGDGQVGTIVRDVDGENYLVTRRWTSKVDEVDPFSGQPLGSVDMAELQPIVGAGVNNEVVEAFSGDFGSEALRDMINRKGDAGELAQKVKRAERGLPSDPKLAEKALAAKNQFVDWFFRDLYGTLTQKLERSPVFRQFYYREVAAVAEELAPAEAQKILDNIGKSANSLGISAERVVGDKTLIGKLESVAKGAGKGTGTLEEADAYAKSAALRQTKELLYNASERSNLEDILRVVVPFGPAWKEVASTYAKALVEDPTRIRKAQLIFDGGRKIDPDGNGQGFFYKDATTGEYSFNFPLSGEISQLLTGINAPMQAPVKRLSIGLGVIPSVGPVGQIAAKTIIPDTPSTDWISGILFPYGRDQGFDLTPKWLGRINEAWKANTANLQSVYANTYIETVRALAATGEYDLADINDQEKLYADARQKARVLTGLRALGQFLGPTSPAPEFQIETLKGDMYGTQLVKEFQKLQADNYDTAVSEFLKTYGNDAILYVSNKTESVKGGLEATDQFGDWERNNKGLIDKYPDVAGFMAPGGDNFSFEVWSRQVAKGDRRRLSEREIVQLAQYRVAASKYRALKAQLPENPTALQRQWLRDWRVALNKEYPGFPAVAEFNPGEFPRKLEQMRNMVNDSQLADNDVAQALKQYLDARDKALASAKQGGYAGLSSDAAQPLRDWLSSVGQALVQDVPEFARIYDRLLSSEVDQ